MLLGFFKSQEALGSIQLALKELHRSPLLVKIAASLHVLVQQQQQQSLSVDMLRAQDVPSSHDPLQDTCVRLILCITAQQKLLFKPHLFQHVLDLAALLSCSPESGLPLKRLLLKPGEDSSASSEISSSDLLSSAEALMATAHNLALSGLAQWSSDKTHLLMAPLVQAAWKIIFHSHLHRSEAAVFGSTFWRVLELKLSHSARSDPFQWVHCKSLLLLGVHLCESEVIHQSLLDPTLCNNAVRFVSIVARCARGFRCIHDRTEQVLRDSLESIRLHNLSGPADNASLVDSLRLCLADILSEQQEDLSVREEAMVLYKAVFDEPYNQAKTATKEAFSLGTFADLLQHSDCSDEAVDLYQQRALDIYRSNSTNQVMVPFMAKIASLLERKGPKYYSSAEDFYLKAYTLCKSFSKADYHSACVASLLCSFASFLIRKDQARTRSEDAEQCCREALDINLLVFRAQGRNQALVSSQSDLTTALSLLLESVGRDFNQKTETLYRCSLELSERLHVGALGMHRSMIIALTSLAVLFERKNKFKEAESLYHRAADTSEILHAELLSQESHSDCSRALHNMASVLEKQGLTDVSKVWRSRAARLHISPAYGSSSISSGLAATFFCS